jgi:hypothetical protein
MSSYKTAEARPFTPSNDPFNGKFEKAKQELSNVLVGQFSGTLSDAMHLGNTAVMALRLLSGEYSVSEVEFKIKTERD